MYYHMSLCGRSIALEVMFLGMKTITIGTDSAQASWGSQPDGEELASKQGLNTKKLPLMWWTLSWAFSVMTQLMTMKNRQIREVVRPTKCEVYPCAESGYHPVQAPPQWKCTGNSESRFQYSFWIPAMFSALLELASHQIGVLHYKSLKWAATVNPLFKCQTSLYSTHFVLLFGVAHSSSFSSLGEVNT